jgi:hypothetical protein
MTKSFTRVFWGSQDREQIINSFKEMGQELSDDQVTHLSARNKKSCTDIEKQLAYEFPLNNFVTYVYGVSNKEYFDKLGINNVLIHKNPYALPPKYAYTHKLKAFDAMMQDFDEIVFLDWDTKLATEIPVDFWDKLNQKDIFQASLWKYTTPKINHRSGIENKFCPAAGFVYMRDKSIPKRLMELWATAPNKWSPEPSFALLTDELMGGWKGIEEYFKRFEPECYRCKKSPYSKEMKASPCFVNRGHAWRF